MVQPLNNNQTIRYNKMKVLKDRKGQMAGSTAGMVIALIMVAIVLGVMTTNLDSSIALTGTANTTYNTIKTLGWVALTILAVGVIAFVGKWIIGIFS